MGVLKPEQVEVFNTSRGTEQMWLYQKSMFIRIEHDFLCINICWAPRGCWNPSRKARVSTSPGVGGGADVIVSEKDVWLLLLPKNFSRSKTLEKMPRKGLFRVLYTDAERYVTCKRFENAASKAETNVMLTSCCWWWRQFLCRPRNDYT